VLFHGNGALVEDMLVSGIVERLVSRHRVIVIDRPGFGYTARPRTRLWSPQAQAELLWKALARLGVGKAVVLGHSWGTLVALSLALEHPSFVAGLVLVSGYYYPTARMDVPLVSGPAIPVIGDVMRYTVSPAVSAALLPEIMRSCSSRPRCRSGSGGSFRTRSSCGRGSSEPRVRTRR
jgi:pimeloyl-ACP methyl ester carboxylesterase